jgi:hypothetical protein
MSVLGPGGKLRRSFRRFGVYQEESQEEPTGQQVGRPTVDTQPTICRGVCCEQCSDRTDHSHDRGL